MDMGCVLLSKRFGKRRRKSKEYRRGKPYIKNNKVYFGGGTKVIRGKGFLSPLVSIIGNIARGIRHLKRWDGKVITS